MRGRYKFAPALNRHHTVRALLSGLVMLPLLAAANDGPRISSLEQEVRSLRREVQMLAREVDQFRSRQNAAPPSATRPVDPPPSDELPRWVNAAKWQQLRRGMSELDVIGLLGAPTSMRAQGAGRVLFYALEIGSATFLAGSVTVRDGAVTELQAPVLK
jgi:hypothetical protein